MVPSQVKEASGLFTIKSTLYMQPTKADKDSVFHCVVEYMMPGEQIKQKKSDTIKINLNCESANGRAVGSASVLMGPLFFFTYIILKWPKGLRMNKFRPEVLCREIQLEIRVELGTTAETKSCV